MTDDHQTSLRAALEQEVRVAIPAAGFVLRDDSPGWGEDFWLGYLDHPGGFDVDVFVLPSEADVVTSIGYAAPSDEEWRVVDEVLEDLTSIPAIRSRIT
jgi:hypothetical protein